MNIHLNIKVQGRVQGVGFRNFTHRKALDMGIVGFCRNQKDGSVYIEVETTQMKADEFLEWMYKGPPLAKVSKIDVEPNELKKFVSFDIRK